MKKLLSILASVGLVATASTSVVACTDHITIKAADIKEDKANNMWVASWTEEIRFNQHTNYKAIKDSSNKIIGYKFFPYKLHLVSDTRANLDQNNSKPTDMFSFGGPDGSDNPTATFTVDKTDWIHKDGKNQNVWATPNGYTDPNVKGAAHLDIDGILKADQTFKKVTVTVKIPKAQYADATTLKVALIREEPRDVDKYGNQQGQYMGVTEGVIKINLPASSSWKD